MFGYTCTCTLTLPSRILEQEYALNMYIGVYIYIIYMCISERERLLTVHEVLERLGTAVRYG